MLKFLEGRETEGRLRATIRKRPEIAFGNEYAMISPGSYVNPYVELQRRRIERLAPEKAGCISPAWTHKANMSLIEEGRVIGSGDLEPRPDRYHLDYHEEIRKNSSRFRLTKGEFTNYLERNHRNNQGFGPLTGEERSLDKSLQTRRSLLQDSLLMLETSREKLQMEQLLRKKSSKELERIIDLKRTLRHKRDDLYHHHRSEVSERKEKLQQTFLLPKVITHRDRPNDKPADRTIDKASSDKTARTLPFGIFRTIDNSTLAHYIK